MRVLSVQFDLLSWGVGVPTGVGVNWLSIWLYNLWRKRRRAGDYFTATWSKERVDFEGNVRSEVAVEEIVHKLFELAKGETQHDDKFMEDCLPAKDSAK